MVMYQLLHAGIDLDLDNFVSKSSVGVTRGHYMKLAKPQAVSRVRRNALSIRTLNDWNALPPQVVLTETLNQFKSRLDQHWHSIQYYVPIQDLTYFTRTALNETGTFRQKCLSKSREV